ncbi:MAG: thioredoxin [Pseudomonadota bacterium]|nr:thioredoxin [Pseudomonadota bacterium]
MSDINPAAFFEHFPMQRVHDADIDRLLGQEPVTGGRIRILFLWGRDCPNCEIAKARMLLSPARFQWPDVEWLHDNVYEDPAMGTRFGLHGIPAFIVFRGGRRLGRIGQWPGTEAFVAAIEKIRSGDG